MTARFAPASAPCPSLRARCVPACVGTGAGFPTRRRWPAPVERPRARLRAQVPQACVARRTPKRLLTRRMRLPPGERPAAPSDGLPGLGGGRFPEPQLGGRCSCTTLHGTVPTRRGPRGEPVLGGCERPKERASMKTNVTYFASASDTHPGEPGLQTLSQHLQKRICSSVLWPSGSDVFLPGPPSPASCLEHPTVAVGPCWGHEAEERPQAGGRPLRVPGEVS